jgi:hypothetical protein
MPKRKQPFLKKLKHLSKLQLAAIALVIIFTAAAAYVAFGRNSSPADNQATSDKSGQSQDGDNSTVNLNPPTAAQQQSTNDYKKSLSQPPQPPPTTSSGKHQVYPVVTGVTADVRNTNCVNIPISLSGGHWSIVVSYSSASYEGRSTSYPVDL